MEITDMKNIVVLRNLPSNLVDEAIVILKPNKRVKNPEQVTQFKNFSSIKSEKSSNQYVIQEAELLVSSYISKIENPEKNIVNNKNIKNKYKKLRLYSVLITIMLLVSIISKII